MKGLPQLGTEEPCKVQILVDDIQKKIGVKRMNSYWYVTRSKTKPKNRGLVSILPMKNYTIVELAVEADCDALKRHDLHYVGYGKQTDAVIQVGLLREARKMR